MANPINYCQIDDEGTMLLPIDLNYMQLDNEEREVLVPILVDMETYPLRKRSYMKYLGNAIKLNMIDIYIECNKDHPDPQFYDEWVRYVKLVDNIHDTIDYDDYVIRRMQMMYEQEKG